MKATFVLTTEEQLTEESARKLKEGLEEELGIKVVVVTGLKGHTTTLIGGTE